MIIGSKSSIIPESIKCIGEHAFIFKYQSKELIISDIIESIENQAFSSSYNIEKVYIGKNVKYIGTNPFDYCDLKEIEVSDKNKIYYSRNNSNAIIETSSNTLISGSSNTIIPDTVKIIGDSAFCGCLKLKEIKIPSSVSIIESDAFAYTDSLKSIELPENIKVEENAFYCSNIKSLRISKGAIIETLAFGFCDKLESIFNLDNAKSLGEGSFFCCYNVKIISLNKNIDAFMNNLIFENFPNLETIIYKNKEYKKKNFIKKELSNTSYWYFENKKLIFEKV